MTPDFDSRNDSLSGSKSSPGSQDSGSAAGATFSCQRDRFELLSAYMDGEVTAAERRQVESWLTEDPTVQRLHARLLKLRQGMQSLPIPAQERPVEQTVERVLARVERRPQLSLVWGGAAIAALFVGAFSLHSSQRNAIPQLAVSPQQQIEASPKAAAGENSEGGLMIALDRPVIAIPKTATAVPPSGSKNLDFSSKDGNSTH